MTHIPRPGRGCDADGLMLAPSLFRPHRAAVEVGVLVALYAAYEGLRGTREASLALARDHTADIVSLERGLHVFHERAVQEWSHGVPYLPALLGLAYMSLHFGATTLAVRWVYRERPEAFPVVRTTLIAATALAAGRASFFYPAAPPRLAGIGFSRHGHGAHGVEPELGSARGASTTPLAAVPSMHFGYALIVGGALVALARRRWVRVLGAATIPRSCSSTSSPRGTTSCSTRRRAPLSSPPPGGSPAGSSATRSRPRRCMRYRRRRGRLISGLRDAEGCGGAGRHDADRLAGARWWTSRRRVVGYLGAPLATEEAAGFETPLSGRPVERF